ncbi:MAG: 30S ribosomal protein S8 [Patescibacteria group bacterium]|nr:30S ribosomal protein S8 [Patescibacteria group bacterium]
MDPIADMLTSIRNAQSVSKETVKVPFSKLKFEIAKILEKEGFINKAERKGKKIKKFIEIDLKYEDKTAVISGLRKVSKPGQRIYISSKEIRPVRSGYGISIISTSKGLMTNKKARRQNMGGEVICEIW